MARFERSTLAEHKDTRTVVLRFLKIITPVKLVIPLYDGRIGHPKEGELYKKPRHTGKNVWSLDVDKSKSRSISRGFQLLWDA